MKQAFNNEILLSFYEVHKMLYSLAKSDAENSDLTVVQLKALYKLSAHPDIGLVELAESLKLTNSTVSGVVDRLVQSELVERTTSKHDRRAIVLRLTKTGEQKLEQLITQDSQLAKKLAAIKEELPAEDLQKLLTLHQKIVEILK